MAELKKRGPLAANEFQDYVASKRSDGWTSASDVSRMLFHLLLLGEAMVFGRRGNQNLWGLAVDFLPDWVDKKVLSQQEFEREAAQKALRALGTATAREIHYYFPRARYLQLEETLKGLKEESKIRRVHVKELGARDERYIHEEDVPAIESVVSDEWEPRMTFLAPFDNLIADHSRAGRLFGFDYVHENFLPKEKRKFGTFVYPILYGDRLIGRADLLREKAAQNLRVIGLFAEPAAPKNSKVLSKLWDTLTDLAGFLGAREVLYPARFPSDWE